MIGNKKRGSAWGGAKAAVWGLSILTLVFGFALAGCSTDSDDGGDKPPAKTPANATIKLESSADNTFTLTLTGATWQTDAESWTIGKFFREDVGFMESTKTSGADLRTVLVGGYINYAVAIQVSRTSDTVLTCTLSKDAYDHVGTLTLKSSDWWAMAYSDSSDGTMGALFLHIFTNEGVNNEGYKGTVTVAEGSGTVNVNFPAD